MSERRRVCVIRSRLFSPCIDRGVERPPVAGITRGLNRRERLRLSCARWREPRSLRVRDAGYSSRHGTYGGRRRRGNGSWCRSCYAELPWASPSKSRISDCRQAANLRRQFHMDWGRESTTRNSEFRLVAESIGHLNVKPRLPSLSYQTLG